MTIIPSINYSVAVGKSAVTKTQIEGAAGPLPPGYQEWSTANGVGGPTENEDADNNLNAVEFALGHNPKVKRNFQSPYIGTMPGPLMVLIFEHPPGTGDMLEVLIGDGIEGPWRPAKYNEVTGSNPNTGSMGGWDEFANEKDFKDYVAGRAAAKWIPSYWGTQANQVCAKAKIGEPGGFLSLRVKC